MIKNLCTSANKRNIVPLIAQTASNGVKLFVNATYITMLLVFSNKFTLCGVSSWTSFVDRQKSSFLHTNLTYSNTSCSNKIYLWGFYPEEICIYFFFILNYKYLIYFYKEYWYNDFIYKLSTNCEDFG